MDSQKTIQLKKVFYKNEMKLKSLNLIKQLRLNKKKYRDISILLNFNYKLNFSSKYYRYFFFEEKFISYLLINKTTAFFLYTPFLHNVFIIGNKDKKKYTKNFFNYYSNKFFFHDKKSYL